MNGILEGFATLLAASLLTLSCTSTDNTASATVADGESGQATNSIIEAAEDTHRLVTVEGNDAGWVIVGETSQWLSPGCRSEIESNGGSFETVAWDVIAPTTDPVEPVSCEAIAGDASPSGPTPTTVPSSSEPQLSRGINFAGDFEVEPRGAWGQPILDEDFALAAAAGFDHIRVPIRWSSYTGPAPDFTIDPSFAAEVDHLVELAHEAGLTIVIDVHHFEELDADPANERARYLAIWEQLATHYRDEPPSVVFELLNEPIGLFNDQPELWNQLAAEALAVVRTTNPTRTVIIGPVSYNHADRLDDLRLPEDDYLVATIHTYDPDSFTVQGAVFIDPVPATGVTWRAGNASVAFGWGQQSWDVRLAPTVEGIAIEWDRTFAAFAVGSLDEPNEFSEVQITASEAFEAMVLCNYDGAGAQEAGVVWTGTTGTADVSGCGALSSLALQHTGSTLRQVSLSRLAACEFTCEELIMTQWDSLDALITGAADWAGDRDMPLYIGEFGTYNAPGAPIDPESRFAWTNAIRSIAEQNDAGWAYFAMNDEFGAYDRTTNGWLPEIVDALLN